MEQATASAGPRRGPASLRRQAVDIGGASLIKARFIQPDATFPLVVEPVGGAVDLAEWAATNRDTAAKYLLKHGAVLFRGFGVNNPANFEKVCSALCPTLFAEYGDLPREGTAERVYESTPYPPDQTILFHNESSHLPSWPRQQFFACMVPARERGETPLLDSRAVYRRLNPDTRATFEEKGLMYVRNFVEGIDVSWRKFFHTDDKAVVEAACAREGMDCEWTAGDSLRVRSVTRAVWNHPTTGEKVFFNQVQLHHPYCLGVEVRASLRGIFKEEDMPRNVYYGDGSAIADDTMAVLDRLYWEMAVQFPWQAGDLIMLDNMLVAHARNPYVGPRKIVVAMGDMIHGKEL